MAPIISLDSFVEIMSQGLDEGLMCNSVFINASSDISLKQLNTFQTEFRCNRKFSFFNN